MWTMIYMSKDENDIALLKAKFKDSGILAMVRKNQDYFEILVPSCEISLAHDIIIDAEI